MRPDSVQNGVGLSRLSLRLVELQSKPFLSVEIMMTKIAVQSSKKSIKVIMIIGYLLLHNQWLERVGELMDMWTYNTWIY